MWGSFMKNGYIVLSAVVLGLCGSSAATAASKILIVDADYTGSTVKTAFDATGLFSSVDYLDLGSSDTLTSADLAGYDGAFVYTNYQPVDPGSWGDALKTFVDGGGQLTLATYGFSSPWTITGGITGAGYTPFLDSGVNGDISGTITPIVTTDKVFNGVNLAGVSYFHNANYAQPTLAGGAVLVASDGSTGLIAHNAAGTVYGFNIYPGINASSDTYLMMANSLTGQTSSAPEPASWAMMLGGFGAIGGAMRARRKAAVTFA